MSKWSNVGLILFAVSTICDILNTLDNANASNVETSSDKRLETQTNVNKRIYKPEWGDLDTRPLPQWYDRAKVGIFIHWGVYSVPSFYNEWFMILMAQDDPHVRSFMNEHYRDVTHYTQFAPMFTAEHFDPDEWTSLFKKAGARYVVLTTKHHDGFALYPSKTAPMWNSVDVGPKRDIVGDLAEAVKKVDMKFGVYHSLQDWREFRRTKNDMDEDLSPENFVNDHLWPDIKQLVNNYTPSILWFDGHWEAKDSIFKSVELLAWLYNDSPVKTEIVVNDRMSRECDWKHGDFYVNIADDIAHYNERFIASLRNHKWENALNMDKFSWGYRRDMESKDVLTIYELIRNLVLTVSYGGKQCGTFWETIAFIGNILINVGPTKEGIISEIFKSRLLTLGEWLEVNGAAIYDTSPWFYQGDSMNNRTVWYTCTKMEYNASSPTAVPKENDTIVEIFAMTLTWPSNDILRVKDIAPYLQSAHRVELLGLEGKYLNWTIAEGVAEVSLPNKNTVKSTLAWTLRFSLK